MDNIVPKCRCFIDKKILDKIYSCIAVKNLKENLWKIGQYFVNVMWQIYRSFVFLLDLKTFSAEKDMEPDWKRSKLPVPCRGNSAFGKIITISTTILFWTLITQVWWVQIVKAIEQLKV